MTMKTPFDNAVQTEAPKADPNRYPPGLDAVKVQAIIDYYDNQTEEEAVAEIENAEWVGPPGEIEGETWVSVPNELVPAVHELLDRQAKG